MEQGEEKVEPPALQGGEYVRGEYLTIYIRAGFLALAI
jgi:hypothetical protein